MYRLYKRFTPEELKGAAYHAGYASTQELCEDLAYDEELLETCYLPTAILANSIPACNSTIFVEVYVPMYDCSTGDVELMTAVTGGWKVSDSLVWVDDETIEHLDEMVNAFFHFTFAY